MRWLSEVGISLSNDGDGRIHDAVGLTRAADEFVRATSSASREAVGRYLCTIQRQFVGLVSGGEDIPESASSVQSMPPHSAATDVEGTRLVDFPCMVL